MNLEIRQAHMVKTRPPNIMHEMLRSFVTLAKLLNLSHAVKALSLTRSTVRRHIEELQALRGAKLFTVNNHRYSLTDEGILALFEAEQILRLANAWARTDTKLIDGLMAVNFFAGPDVPYYAQQHSIDSIWKNGTPLIQQGLHCWTQAKAKLEATEFTPVRDYLLAYRRHHLDWLCVYIGEKSSYATWLGWSWAKSAVGRPLFADPMASAADEYVNQSYDGVLQSGGARIDHIYTKIARGHGGEPQPISYQRLTLRCKFPNDEYALVTLIDRTDAVQITDLCSDDFVAMDSALIMKYAND